MEAGTNLRGPWPLVLQEISCLSEEAWWMEYCSPSLVDPDRKHPHQRLPLHILLTSSALQTLKS